MTKRRLGIIATCVGLAVGVLLGIVSVRAYDIAIGIIYGRTIQSLESGSGHNARLLKKYNLADINFKVLVDGQMVYVGPDLVGLPDHLYRETLVWDKTGRVVVLELMGRRVFAYDAQEKRPLEKGEINNYELNPSISENYFFAPISDIEEGE
jgi:hypothetical protein